MGKLQACVAKLVLHTTRSQVARPATIEFDWLPRTVCSTCRIAPQINNSQFAMNKAEELTLPTSLSPQQQQQREQLPRLIIVHHTLPWSFSPKPASHASEQQLSDTIVVDTLKSPRLRSRSFSNLHSRKVNTSLHCIRPSICNHLAECSIGDNEDDMRKTEWRLEERLNHPALQASEARGVSERIFVGWPGHCLDDANREVDELTEDTKEALRQLYLPLGGIPVFLSSIVAHNAFNGYYRTLLWPLFHYAIKELPFLDAINQNRLWLDYEAVNRAYFDAVVSVYRPGDIGTALVCLPFLLSLSLSLSLSIVAGVLSIRPDSTRPTCHAASACDGIAAAVAARHAQSSPSRRCSPRLLPLLHIPQFGTLSVLSSY